MPAVPISRIPFILDARIRDTLPSDIPVAFQGVVFKPPASGLWVRPTCLSGDMEDAEKGQDGYSRRHGLYQIDIFAPADQETADAWDLAARLESAFRRQCLSGVQTEDPSTNNLGVDKYDKFQIRVSVPWWAWAV